MYNHGNNEEKIINVQRQLRGISSLLSQYSWLADAFVLDFFVETHWDRLPKSWQQILDETTLEELSIWLDPRVDTPRYKQVWPLSLQALRVAVHSYSLTRKVSCTLENFLPHKKLNVVKLDNTELYTKYRRHIKAKKLHEIARLTEVISAVVEGNNCRNIIDVGSGQGHLSRILALVHGYKVVSIEAQSSYVHGAQKYDLQALRECKGPDEHVQPAPRQLQVTVETNIDEQAFEQIIITGLSNQESVRACPTFALVGLHTCGDLASTMLKLFSKSKQAIALVSVPCCYMKITEMFPMSNFLSTHTAPKLTYAALEVACHAIEMHADKLKDASNISKLKVHCYRACLEQLIRQHHPQMHHLGLSVKNSHTMTFAQYAEIALQKGNLNGINSCHFHCKTVRSNMSQWKRVITFYSLRIAIAPLIESLVLLDRMLYLLEKGMMCTVVPIFDATLSPRNHALVAFK